LAIANPKAIVPSAGANNIRKLGTKLEKLMPLLPEIAELVTRI